MTRDTGRRAAAVEALWRRDALGTRLLAPAGWLYAAGTWVRNGLYDLGLARAHALGLPAVSVGNLSVGGTGKTPISAWVAQWFEAKGLRPGILLRGYGDDEPLVHRRLTPGAVVVAAADRVTGAAAARREGAQVLVLDDAFQHRRARRDVDLVLLSADWRGSMRPLPAGPFREGLGALRRADGIIVTRKQADPDEADAVLRRARPHVGGDVAAIVHLAPGDLVAVAGASVVPRRPLADLRGARVLAISAIGDPAAYAGQLAALGAAVEAAAYPDHHAFTAEDAATLARRGAAVDVVVCTLKDAVKLEGRWPAQAPPLWYLSQAVRVERGGAELDALLGRSAAAGAP